MAAANTNSGRLFVVATPIGNLDDISMRAVQTLRTVDVIAAEDTRHTSVLLRHLAIVNTLLSLHEHNELRRAPGLVERMLGGQSVALVSDAGTPLVSDPGYRLVTLAREAGIIVTPVPGPCAMIAALSACGLPSSRFTFEGFLPAAAAARVKALSMLAGEARTMVFYESPRRVQATLDDMVAVFGANRRASLCRELTKRFETIRTDTLDALHHWLGEDDNQRLGEFVIVLEGRADHEDLCRPEWVAAVRELREFMPLKRAARIIAGATGAGSQLLYRLAGQNDSE